MAGCLIIERIREQLNQLRLESKFELFLVTLFCFLAILAVFTARSVMRSYESTIYTLNVGNVDRFSDVINSYLSSIDRFGEYIISDSGFQHNLAEFKDSDNAGKTSIARRSIFRQLNSLQITVPYVSDIAFFLPSGEVIHSGSGYPEDLDFRTMAGGASASNNGRAVWLMDDAGDVYYVRDVRRLQYLKLDHLAYLFIKVNLDRMVDSLRDITSNPSEAIPSDFMIMLYDDRGHILFSDMNIEEDQLEDLESVVSGKRKYAIDDIDGVSYLISGGVIPENGWMYLNFLDYGKLSAGLSRNFILFTVVLLCLLFISCYLIHLMVKHVIRHFVVFKDKMIAFSNGNMDMSSFPSYEKRKDEIGILHQEFDEMVVRFDKLIKDNYIKEIMLKDNKIRMLNQQINPHFLYNVLDSIYWSAQCNGAKDIAKMSYNLARLFRIATADDSLLVPLEKEIEYLDSYLQIQMVRFPERLRFKKNAASDTLSSLVPRLSIQPLVENAVKHVIQEEDIECYIVLESIRDGDDVMISVRNTGSEFPDDIEERIKNGKTPENHIGLRNINERLILHFGEKSRLFFSNADGFATVGFTVPYSLGDKSNAQSPSCR